MILFLVSLALGALNADAGAGCIVDGLQSSYRQRPVSSSQLVSQAKQLVLRQEARFQRYFEDTGFADQAAFDDAVRVYSEPAAMLADWLQNEKHIEFATNVPESARSAISGKGFRNLRATDGPVANAEEIELRDLVEAVKSGYSPREYKTFDADLKPSYGYLKPGPDSGLIPSQLASHYGDDTYIFKKGRVRDRLTWTAGDSFGPARYANGKTQPENWRDFFVPWKNRTLMIPDILDAVSLQKTGFSAEFVNGTGAPMPPPRPLLSFEPKAPPKSRLPSPVPPPVPDYPLPPPMPIFPDKPQLPKGPVRLPGESTSSYLKRYAQTAEYQKFKAEMTDIAKVTSQTLQKHQSSKRYQEYLKRVKAVDQRYQETDAYEAFLKSKNEYLRARQKAEDAYRESKEFKSYLSELNSWKEEAAKLQRKYESSDEYRAYEKILKAYDESEEKKLYMEISAFAPKPDWLGTSIGSLRGPHTSGYIELQYWGPLNLDDVEIFEFRKTPPSGEFLEELRRRGIQIRDGRRNHQR